MKKLTTLMAAGLAVLAYHTADAQVGVHLSFSFGNAPVYQSAPVNYPVYDNSDDYYYLPDVEAYYSVPQHCYYYNDGNNWVANAYLPGRYHDFDWRTARHYEIREQRPFMHHDMYRTRYGGFDRGNGYGGNPYANRGGFDRPDNHFGGNPYANRGGFDNHDRRFPDNGYTNGGQYQNRSGFDQRGGFDGNRNNNRGGMPQGGYNQGMPQNDNRGQYQNGNGGQPQGGYNNGRNQGGGMNGQPANNGGQPQGGYNSGRNQGGGMNEQPSNNAGQGRGGQPSNDGQGRRSGVFNGDNHFAANQMGVVRPPRF